MAARPPHAPHRPAAQFVPCLHDVAPAWSWYLPNGQLLQDGAPAAAALHLPAGQAEHDVVAEAPLYVPAGHVEALAWPVADA